MNNLSDLLSIDQVGSIFNYFSTSNYPEHVIYVNYFKMLNILASESLNSIILFFEENNNMFQYLNFYFNKLIYPIHYLFENPNLDVEMIEFLVFNKSKLSYKDEDKSIIQILINNTGISDDTVLKILNYLKDNSYDFNFIDIRNNNIHHLLANGIHINEDIFNIFSDNNKNTLNEIGETPLLISTRLNNDTYTNLLLESKDCDINLVNTNNNCALMYACMNNNKNIIDKLLNLGADINQKDNQKDVPLFYLCGCDTKTELDLELIKYFCSKGCNINEVSEDSYTCLHYASGCYSTFVSIEVVKYFLEIGVEESCIDKRGHTFIDYLVDFYEKDYIYDFLFKEKELSINIKNSLILNEFNISFLKQVNCKFDKNLKCNISHCQIESNEMFYKCTFGHCYDNDLLIKWYKESKKYLCPLCMNVVDLSIIYKVCDNN